MKGRRADREHTGMMPPGARCYFCQVLVVRGATRVLAPWGLIVACEAHADELERHARQRGWLPVDGVVGEWRGDGGSTSTD